MAKQTIGLLVGTVFGALLTLGVTQESLLVSKTEKLLGIKPTIAALPENVDVSKFCEAMGGRDTLFRLTLAGDVKLLIPAENEEQAKFMAGIGYVVQAEKNLKESYDVVKFAGCATAAPETTGTATAPDVTTNLK